MPESPRPRPLRRWSRPLPLLAAASGALSLAACIEDRISVDIFTQLQADGSCTRRITYRVERVDTEKGGARVGIPPEKDPLRSFRIPSGEPWRVQHDVETGVREITVEASLPSPAAIEGDWSRTRSKNAPPAHNVVSALSDAEAGVYEYLEVLQDPGSPLAGARLLARLALRYERRFADAFTTAFTSGAAPREAELRGLYRGLLAEPFAREVTRLGDRPFYGPRERRELERLLESLDGKQRELVAAIAILLPGTPETEVEETTERAMSQLSEGIVGELEEAGLPLLSPGDGSSVRFHARLVMPAPIQRANTCFVGDTAEWEFTEDDLFGRGFEMKAYAASR